MKLRDEIECNIIKAKQIYPQVLDLIDKYDNACNIEDKEKCVEIIQQLSILTGKHITENDLFEHWEGDGTEELAFRFCLSEPPTLATPLLEKNLNLPKSFNIRTDAFNDNDAAPIEILEIILKAMKLKTDNKQQTA